ncbi:MAG: hypothetical protein EXS16_08065 [Gemmataceae bacterium]|nr:hypothetical protein [Gemmataceae bacterium]
MFDLTEHQHNEIAMAGDQPVTAIDTQTKTVYVLVRQEIYERFSAVIEDDNARHFEALFEKLDSEDWEDASNYEDAK